MAEREVLLEIKQLNKEFQVKSENLFGNRRTLYALSDIDLQVFKGETLGIIGESGCGKTTLGRCIVGLHKPTSGELTFSGTALDYGRNGKQQHREIQMIFQDPYSSLNPRKTCETLIEEPMLIHHTIKDKHERAQKVNELIHQVGLDDQHTYRYPHEFSGGQRQRINIARALALEPKMIVCDEPVSALDVSIQAQILNLFVKIQKELGLTYIFISHDLSVVRYISDRIAIMYLGRIVELSDSESIYSDPKHPYTQALLSAVPANSPFIKKERIKLKGDIPSPIGEQKGCPLAFRCPHCTERCRNEIPQLKDVGNGHQTACFLYQ